MAHPGGRPLKFETVEDLSKAIEDYFNSCLPHPEEQIVYEYHQIEEEYIGKDGETKTRMIPDKSLPPYETKQWVVSPSKTPTITGLAVHLDTSRQTLINYEERDEFFDTIKKAKDIIENHWEEMLKGNNVTGVIFNLKNNYAWKDKTEAEISNPDGSLNPFNKLSVEELKKLAKDK